MPSGIRVFDPSAISPDDFDDYVRAYEVPGAMRAAFELYRTFDGDGRALRAALAEGGKLSVPTLAVTGEMSGLGEAMPEMVREIVDRVEVVAVPRSGHWVPEENPTLFAEALLNLAAGGHHDEADHHTRSLAEADSSRR
jgi:pimeloyl-ACP methyl ester carboxylesterase